jgi:hypothetical protein
MVETTINRLAQETNLTIWHGWLGQSTMQGVGKINSESKINLEKQLNTCNLNKGTRWRTSLQVLCPTGRIEKLIIEKEKKEILASQPCLKGKWRKIQMHKQNIKYI